MRQLRTGLALAVVTTAFATSAVAQPAPNTQGGRYSFVPVREGLMRLDVRSGPR